MTSTLEADVTSLRKSLHDMWHIVGKIVTDCYPLAEPSKACPMCDVALDQEPGPIKRK